MNKMKLFFIPYAGGESRFFEGTAKLLPEGMECHLLDYAGHGTRMRESFYASNEEMVLDIADKINSCLSPGDRMAIFGYSMGSMVTYELLARQLLAAVPEHIFLASHEAPDVEWESKQYYRLDDEELIEVLRPKGGFERVIPALLKQPRFYNLFFRPLKEDYRLIGTYQMSSFSPLPVPATVFYSPEDMTSEQIHTWDRFLPENSTYYSFSGKHFFIRSHEEEIAQILAGTLLKNHADNSIT